MKPASSTKKNFTPSHFGAALDASLGYGDAAVLSDKTGYTVQHLSKIRTGRIAHADVTVFRRIVENVADPETRANLIRARLRDELPTDDLPSVTCRVAENDASLPGEVSAALDELRGRAQEPGVAALVLQLVAAIRPTRY